MRHLISLGERCDVAFQLRMHGRENVAHFFDWLACEPNGVISIFEQAFDVFHPDHLMLVTDATPHYVQDIPTGAKFHHQFPHYGGHVPVNFLLFYTPFIKKFTYLAARLRYYLDTKAVTLVRRDITEAEALRLEAAVLRLHPQADIAFLYLLSKGAPFSTPRGHARLMPYDGSSLGDPAAWSAMLREEGLIETPYRHATAEILGHAHDDHNLSTENRFSEAQLQEAVAANPLSEAFALELAAYYRARSQPAQAEALARTALTLSEGGAAAKHLLAAAQWMQGQIDAREAARLFCDLADDKASLALLRDCASALAAAGQRDEALTYIGRALRMDSLDRGLYFEKAKLLLQAERFSDADLAIEAAMALGAYPDIFLHVKAKILEGLGRRAEAIEAEQKSIAMGGGFQSIFNLGGLFMRTGQYEKAAYTLQSALAMAGPHADTVQRFLNEARQHIMTYVQFETTEAMTYHES